MMVFAQRSCSRSITYALRTALLWPECPAAWQVGTVAGQVGSVAPVADSAVGQLLVGHVVVVHFGSKHLTTVHQLGHWFQQLVGCATLALQGHNLEQEQVAPKLEFPEWL
jgi:hypothetical protein